MPNGKPKIFRHARPSGVRLSFQIALDATTANAIRRTAADASKVFIGYRDTLNPNVHRPGAAASSARFGSELNRWLQSAPCSRLGHKVSTLFCIFRHRLTPFVALHATSLAGSSSPQPLTLVFRASDQRKRRAAVRTDWATDIDAPSSRAPVCATDNKKNRLTSKHGCEYQSYNVESAHTQAAQQSCCDNKIGPKIWNGLPFVLTRQV